MNRIIIQFAVLVLSAIIAGNQQARAGIALEYDMANRSVSCVQTPENLDSSTGLGSQAIKVIVRDGSDVFVLFESFGCSLYKCCFDNDTTKLEIWSDFDFSADNWCLKYDCDSCTIDTISPPSFTLMFTSAGIEGRLSMNNDGFPEIDGDLPQFYDVLNDIANYTLWDAPALIKGYLKIGMSKADVKEFINLYIDRIKDTEPMHSDPLFLTYIQQTKAFYNFFLEKFDKTLDFDELKQFGELSAWLSQSCMH